MRTRPRKLAAIVAVLTAAMVLAGTATAQATTGALDHEQQAAAADTAQATTSAEPGSEDQDSGATTDLMPVCDVSCDYCDISPFCDPCIENPFLPECGPFPGPPDPPEPPLVTSCATDNISITRRAVLADTTVTLTPHVRWCWRGLDLVSIEKTDVTNTVSGIVNVTVTKETDDTPTRDTLGNAYHYTARYTITTGILPFTGLENKCYVQFDRYYPVGGQVDASGDTSNCSYP
jgi:hypothetical protein